MSPVDVAVVVGLLLSCITDIRTRKIRNVVTFPMMLAGLGLHVLGEEGIVFAALGLGATFVANFVLWTAGVFKAGDAKLLMGVGALWGWVEGVEATLWTLVALLPVGLIYLAVRGRLGNMVAILRARLYTLRGLDPGREPEPTYMPLAPVVAVGAGVARFTEVLGAWA